ncbi:MAG: hypothetical protein R3292_10190 [Alcanivorax sp.]|nr:hypothetical protein [Alcanivorax sp.]
MRFLVAISLALLASWAQGQCQFAPLDQGRVVTLSAQQLPQGQGLPIDKLSVMRYENHRFVPVAFQFDELDEHGLVWFAATGFAHDGKPGIFDHHDQLMMMLTDAGERAPPGAVPDQGHLLAGIAVAKDCHYYLVADNPTRSDRYYVSHNPDTGVTRTALYQMDVQPSNELNWLYLGYRGYQGKGSIIDTLKMRMSAGVLSRFTRMTLDNHNLRPEPLGHRLGPIRSVMHLKTRVVFAGIPVMTLQVQAMRYASFYQAHSYAVVPDLYRAALKEPEVSVSIDGNAQYGARVYTARHQDNPVVVDGKPDAKDMAFADQAVTMDQNWILFDSGKHFVLLTKLTVPKELDSLPLGLVYQDDAALDVEPEQFPGQLPNLGYVIKGWPKPRELRFSVTLYFDSGMHGMSAGEFAAQRAATVHSTVTTLPAGS